MSGIDLANALAPANSAIGNSLARNVTSKDKSQLDQTDFMKLLVAQVKNQDPSKPMDPSQFMNQLAQLSTVKGVQNLNTSFNSLAGKLSSSQALQAAGLVGRDVLIAGGTGVLNTGSSIRGQIVLPQSAADVTLKVINAQGAEVRSLPLGSGAAGNMQFQWDGFKDDGSVAPPGQYRLVAEASTGGTTQALSVAIDTRVNSITLSQGGGNGNGGVQLNLASGSVVPFDQVLAIN